MIHVTSLLNRKINSTTWPHVARVPRGGIRAFIAAMLWRRVVERVPIRVVLPDGTTMPNGSKAADCINYPTMRLLQPAAFYSRLGHYGLIGFGESYQASEWESDDLPGILQVLATHVESLVPAPAQRLRRLFVAKTPASQSNAPENSANNISHHYDLSNELFGLFLDETMTYSAALFAPAADGATAESLADAQRRKIDRLLDSTGVTRGSRVLEIGTGWGELAIRAAQRGAYVDTITLSQEQYDYTSQRISREGLADQVNVELRDYRQITGRSRYDAILSVEMIEAVGAEYWATYFDTIDRLLAPGGRLGLQAITMQHNRMLVTRNNYTWIHKYIFPGGLIPSVTAIEDHIHRYTRLSIIDRCSFGQDYARTLQLWRERFNSNARRVDSLGFDEIFRRTWRFYLSYSQAGFASGYLDVNQFVMKGSQ